MRCGGAGVRSRVRDPGLLLQFVLADSYQPRQAIRLAIQHRLRIRAIGLIDGLSQVRVVNGLPIFEVIKQRHLTVTLSPRIPVKATLKSP